ncbi:Trypsin-like peptidase domain-containing protein [Quadrisphaera granulorum]|uniref:Serine protease n=2 Tax=Quadrisphaera granulorum TaxID=317664 RepID=A0A316A5T8_9ACTN|nr:trypsin-like peptidase [Quadrisphaera granulorum]SZE97271.1 Trypsin-like peptidase domain-containing protein [Quadrisphaera granulorum]
MGKVDPVASAAGAVAAADEASALRTAVRASVRVRSVGCASVRTGSGFAVDAHTLVTNAHVVDGAEQLQVDTWDGQQLAVTASVTATVADLAVVRTVEALPATVPLAAVDPERGEAVTVVGYPRGEALAKATGVVTGSVDDPLGTAAVRVLQLEAAVAPGSSGSAVVDDDGAVVGVLYAGATTGQDAYAVPVGTLRAALAAEGPADRSVRC